MNEKTVRFITVENALPHLPIAQAQLYRLAQQGLFKIKGGYIFDTDSRPISLVKLQAIVANRPKPGPTKQDSKK